jgi:hypothetical protein
MAPDQYRHLGMSAIEVIELSAEERIAKIQSRRFTEFPRCRVILDNLHEQIQQQAGTIKPNILVWGGPGQGKTTIMKKHLRDHPAVFKEQEGVRCMPVVGMEMPPMCDVKWLYTHMLRAIDARITNSRGSIPDMAERIFKLYKLIGVRQIVIDEAHNMLVGGDKQQRTMLSVMRHMSNELEIPIVLFGTQDAREALMHDPQLTRRFRFIELPAWESGDEFLTLIGSILRALPLRRPSPLTARALKTLLSFSGGVTATLFEVMTNLGIDAIQSGEERITPDMVAGYVSLPVTV